MNIFKTPGFWYNTRSPISFFISMLMLPASWAYHIAVLINKQFYKKFVPPYRSKIPLICVGNLVAGGAGKTPTALALAKHLKETEFRVAFISRGYGSKNIEPVKVNPEKHTYLDVGDEALMLSHFADTYVCINRVEAIKMAEKSDADIIITDDGLQNLSFIKDLKILVINGLDGFGNQKMLPAGPLRDTIESTLPDIDLVIMTGEDKHHLKNTFNCPFIFAEAIIAKNCPSREAIQSKNKQKSVVLFAGIGRPEKFFNTIKYQLAIPIAATKTYPDHYPYAEKEVDELKHLAIIHHALLMTTMKDHYRLPKDFKKNVIPVTIDLILKNQAQLDAVLNPILNQLQ